MRLPRQISIFFGVGLVSIVADYGTLMLLREVFDVHPVYGALAGYLVGGVVNYLLNRAHTFATDRDHVEAGWRFASVMVVGFSLTGLFMWIFAEKLEIPYLMARVATTGIVFCWNFGAHKMWTFGERKG
jgi:putative flippase GtrA